MSKLSSLKDWMDELRRLSKKGYPDATDAVRWYDSRPPEIKNLMRLYPPGKYSIIGRELHLYGYGDKGDAKGAVLMFLDENDKEEKCCTACLIKSEILGASWPIELQYQRDLDINTFKLPECLKH